MDFVVSVDDAAARVLKKAKEALDQGTFAVGGILFRNDTGKIVKELHNNVYVQLKNHTPFLNDPTAHGERQLVSWYYDNKSKLNLPDPVEMTLVTSLDPCLMCTGSLLLSGFNVGIIAIDEYAGVNYDSKFDFHILPKSLKSLAQKKFGYYACNNSHHESEKLSRKYIGAKSLPFLKDTVSSKYVRECGTIFSKSVKHVDSAFSKISEIKIDEMANPFQLSEESKIKKSFRKIYPNAFTIRSNPQRILSSEIIDELNRVASHSSGDRNAVAFIDLFGNLILCQSGNETNSPIRTALMEVIQNYCKTLWKLMNDDDTRSVAEKTLTHPRFGTFLFLYAPDPDSATTIMDLGAYSFTLYRKSHQNLPNLQYVNPPRNGRVKDLTSLISRFPPFYSDQVNLSICQIPK
jgi:cytosine deaminase